LKPRAAAIYDRLSAVTETNQDVAWRVAECRRWAEENGWRVVEEEYQDLGKSGWKPRVKRPHWQRLLEDIAAGRVDGVICHHVDRLLRHNRDATPFLNACDGSRTRLVGTVDPGGVLDLNTADGRHEFQQRAIAGEYQSHRASERLRRKHAELARSGRWIGGGHRVFGFSFEGKPRTLAVRPDEAKVIREVARRVLRGDSLTLLTKELNDRGITTAEGKRWKTGVLRRVLLNPTLAGLRVHRRTGQVTEGEWSAILDREVHELLKERLNGNGPPKGVPGPRRYPLTGLLVCGKCGQRLIGSAGSYRCAVVAGGCGGVRASALRVEEVVFGQVNWAWSHDDRKEEPRRSLELTREERALLRKLQEVEARKEQLAERWADLGMDGRQFRAANARLDARVEDLRRQLRDHAPEPRPKRPTIGELHARGTDWMARWRERRLSPAEVESAHAWAAAYVKRVVIRPAKKRGRVFDPTRVRVEFPRRGKKQSQAHE